MVCESVDKVILHSKEYESRRILKSKSLHETVLDGSDCSRGDIHFLRNF